MTDTFSSVPLDGGGLARGEYVVGITPLADRVAVVSMAVQNPPAGDVPEKYLLVRHFDTDLTHLATQVLTFAEPADARPHLAGLESEGGVPVLNTFAERTPTLPDPGAVLAKRVAITADGPVLLGAAPIPEPIRFPDAGRYPCSGGEVRMASEFVMAGFDDGGRQRWRLKLGAYLYMPVEVRGDRAWFGTAGNGGAFHGIDPVTGTEHFRIRTGGTVRYSWWDDDRIVLVDHRTTAVLVVDALDGTELIRIRLGRHVIGDDARQLLFAGSLFVPAFTPDRSQHLLRVNLAG